MIILSLFNGMNTGRQALKNVGIKVDKYYSSEIKPYAIKLTQYHFPDTIQLGDITKWREWDINWAKIDLLLSGSPCQDLSSAGKRAGINGNKSSLFFVFIEILEHIKTLNPNILFLQENVASAKKIDIGIMSRALGVYPCRINSKLVTAQLRDRYYWSNIRTKNTMFDIVTDIPQPKDKKIMFKDIITNGYVYKNKANCLQERCISSVSFKDMLSNKAQIGIKKRERFGINLIYKENNEIKCKTNTKKGYEIIENNDFIDLFYPNSITRRGRINKSKAHTLLTNNSNYYIYKDNIIRIMNKIEMCRLQGFPDNYCDILTTVKAGSLLGDGWTLPVIEHIFSFIKK